MSQYIESDKVELKAKYTDTICKEIVAFLNAVSDKLNSPLRDRIK